MPASFRAALTAQSFQGIVAFRSLTTEAIEGFGMDRMEKLSQHLDHFDFFSQDQDDLTSGIFADAQQLPFDGEGRIVLPENLLQHAQLKDQVAFVGRGPTFQMWNPEAFDIYHGNARKRMQQKKLLKNDQTGDLA